MAHGSSGGPCNTDGGGVPESKHSTWNEDRTAPATTNSNTYAPGDDGVKVACIRLGFTITRLVSVSGPTRNSVFVPKHWPMT